VVRANGNARPQEEERTMNAPDLRQHERLLVPPGLEVRATTNDEAAALEGVATVIGLGGMFLRTRAVPEPGTVMTLTLKCPIVSFQSECAVRHVTPTGLGIEFTKLTPENEASLRKLLVELKN
jgi:hypothetical protein